MTAVRIGSWAGAWGDTIESARTLVERGGVDYLVADHLAEITMALLAKARLRDPAAGHVPDVVRALAPLLPAIAQQGVKVLTNGGGLDPRGCAAAFERAAADAGVELRVAVVEGDDLLTLGGVPGLPDGALTANAYLGARPIAAALDAGADVVVTGRCADSALVLGPLLHEFGWRDDEHDLLSAGSLVGHVLECGTQATGGLFTDWETVPGWDDMGPPIAECHPDGSAVITKPDGTGGLVTPATVGEQIVYEIGDPGAYLLPDVVCDWREVTLAQDGPDRVRVTGARGRPPTTTYKATATVEDGFRLVATALYTGVEAGAKARRVADAVLARAARLAATTFDDTSIEVIGAGGAHGRHERDATEVVLKLGARHPDRAALAVLGREFVPAGLSMAPGMSGVFGGRPRPTPAIAVVSVLVDKTTVPVRVTVGGETREVAIAPGDPATETATPPMHAQPTVPRAHGGPTVPRASVPLVRIAHGRSGDKGDHANIGLIARTPQLLDVLREQVTTERVAEHFAHTGLTGVTAWELPGLHAINFLLHDALGGRGGTTSLRFDPQGKGYAAMLLELEVSVPEELLP